MTEQIKTLTSIFDDICEGNPQQKTIIKRLKANNSMVLRTILQASFSPKIQFPMPAGAPPYEPRGEDVEITDKKILKLAYCTSAYKKMSQLDKETTFIGLLENMSESDGKIIIAAKDGELDSLYPKITEDAVKAAFPKLLA